MHIHIDNLCVDAPGKRILSNVSLQVYPSETVAIVGSSGAGKTTLVKTLIGEVAEGLEVTGGSVTVAGVHPLEIHGRALRSLRRVTSYVDQDPGAALPPKWSVRRIMRQRAALSDTDILSLLNDFGLGNLNSLLDRTPAQLSGGQRRRLGVAAGIISEPKLLIIDEPTAGVDRRTARMMLDTLRIAKQICGATTIVITHDVEVAQELAERIIDIDTQVAASGTPDRVNEQKFHCTAPTLHGAPTLIIEQLGLRHEHQPVVSDFSLTVKKGQTVGLTGPSGRGKTTILRAILGLHPVTEGQIHIQTPCSLGWIPQESELALNPSVPVAKILRRSTKPDREIAAMLENLALPNFLSTPRKQKNHNTRTRADELSGGQRQRVNVARALLTEPNLLLADEPTSALDQANKQRVLAALRNNAANRATLIVSHDPEVLQACDHVVRLSSV